jgi:hypothetical protein
MKMKDMIKSVVSVMIMGLFLASTIVFLLNSISSTVDATTPPSTQPLRTYYSFETYDSSGNVIDGSGNGNSATCYGDIVKLDNGKYSGCLAIDIEKKYEYPQPTDGYLYCNNPGISNSQNGLTIQFSIYMTRDFPLYSGGSPYYPPLCILGYDGNHRFIIRSSLWTPNAY